MKVLLYLEGENILKRSGIGRAMRHQEQALDLQGIPWTRNPKEDFDILHANTYGPKTWFLMRRVRKAGRKVIFHGHSTKEDFKDSFLGSNLIAPLFKWYLMRFYKKADLIITPTAYSAHLLASYGLTCPILPLSNGIDLERYQISKKKELAFRSHFALHEDASVVVSAGLYFKRKGLDDFVAVARQFPDVKFIWFGYQPLWSIPAPMRKIIKNPPANVIFPGYIKGEIYEGALTSASCFFFPSREETEGIVVLEALASKQQILVRKIPVYEGWLGEDAAHFANDAESFARALKSLLSQSKVANTAGYAVAESKSIQNIAQELEAAYQEVLSL